MQRSSQLPSVVSKAATATLIYIGLRYNVISAATVWGNEIRKQLHSNETTARLWRQSYDVRISESCAQL